MRRKQNLNKIKIDFCFETFITRHFISGRVSCQDFRQTGPRTRNKKKKKPAPKKTRNKSPTNTAEQERSRGKFKTNMADLSSVELIEFVRPYNNDVNLYVTNISRHLDKETIQVSFTTFTGC